MPATKLKIAVLISGTGRSLQNILERIAAGTLPVEVTLVLASNSLARGLDFARQAGVPTAVVRRKTLPSDEVFSAQVFDAIRASGAEIVVMAGFMKFLPIPPEFENRVINIHPALIPAFCGHGFYGHHVHEAVIQYGAKLSGCTVHFVDNQYDHGPILLQRVVPVLENDTAESLASRVFQAELEALPEALALIAEGRVQVEGRIVRVR